MANDQHLGVGVVLQKDPHADAFIDLAVRVDGLGFSLGVTAPPVLSPAVL